MTRVILLAFGVACAIVAVQAAGVPPELQKAGETAHAECVKESGVAEELVKKAAEGTLEEDDKLKCYLKCIFVKFGVVDGDKIDFEAIRKVVPENLKESLNEMIDKCQDTTGTDLCDTSFKLNQCFQKVNPKEYFVI